MGKFDDLIGIRIIQLNFSDMPGDQVGRHYVHGSGADHVELIRPDQRAFKGIFGKRPFEGCIHVIVTECCQPGIRKQGREYAVRYVAIALMLFPFPVANKHNQVQAYSSG